MEMPPEEIARAESPRGELVLRRRFAPTAADADPPPRPGPRPDADPPPRPGPTPDAGREVLELRANGVFVMDTEETSSEQSLARRALAAVTRPRLVLVGGLGLGFTLAAVLEDRRVERCTVAEIEPALVDWLRDGTVPHGPALLSDPRVDVQVEDVAALLVAAQPASLDLVLLDVDNGPGYLVHDTNAGLYESPFLATAGRVLRPGGALVVWSAARAPHLLRALEAEYDAVEEVDCPVDLQGRDEHYWLYVARRTPE